MKTRLSPWTRCAYRAAIAILQNIQCGVPISGRTICPSGHVKAKPIGGFLLIFDDATYNLISIKDIEQ